MDQNVDTGFLDFTPAVSNETQPPLITRSRGQQFSLKLITCNVALNPETGRLGSAINRQPEWL